METLIVARMMRQWPVHRVGKCKRFQESRQVRDPPSSLQRGKKCPSNLKTFGINGNVWMKAHNVNRKAGVVVLWKETQQVVAGWKSDPRISKKALAGFPFSKLSMINLFTFTHFHPLSSVFVQIFIHFHTFSSNLINFQPLSFVITLIHFHLLFCCFPLL